MQTHEILKLLSETFSKKLTQLLFLVSSVLIILLVYPIVDYHYSTLNRLEKKTEILKELSNIDTISLQQNPNLWGFYLDIQGEAISYDNSLLVNSFNYFKSTKSWSLKWDFKIFLLGGIFWYLLSLIVIFTNITHKNRTAIILFLIGLVFGLFGLFFPEFKNKIVYLLYPLFQILIFIIVAKIYNAVEELSS